MAKTFQPFGLRPVRHFSGGEIRTQGFERGIADGSTSPLYMGQPVKWDGGFIVAAAPGDTNIAGVFAGVEYRDSGRDHAVQFSPHFPGSATAKNIVVHVHTDPQIIYQIQGANVPATARGTYADFVGTGGNAITGDSAVALGTPGATKANFYIVDRFDIPENPWGANAIVEVVFAEHVLK
jgi:hypothetical protein